MRATIPWMRQLFWPPGYDGFCPVCRAQLPSGAHVCNECKSLVRSPMALVYVAALLTSLPVLGGAAVYAYNERAKQLEQREEMQVAAVSAAKTTAEALERIVGLASTVFRARYHVANACSPYFREDDFFKQRDGESCAPQLLRGIYELDQQVIAVAYQLDVIPGINRTTRERFDSLNTHYWAQASPEHPLVGYRQRIVDAIHGVHDFVDQRPLRECGPIGFPGLDAAGCQRTLQHLRTRALGHLQTQMDAVLCSIVSDVRTLRRLAQVATVSADTELGKRMADDAISEACQRKLTETPIKYEYQ